MFTYFKFKNYLSFKDETIIRFENKVSSKQAEIFIENSMEDDNQEQFNFFDHDKKSKTVLNSVIVYGSNASGKSNLLSPLTFLKSIFVSKSSKPDEKLNKLPFNFVEQPNPITEIEVGFIDELEGVNYYFIYTINIDCEKEDFSYEKLSYSPLSLSKLEDEQIIFERKYGKLIEVQEDIKEIFNKIIMDNISLVPLLKLSNQNINKKLFAKEVDTLPFKMLELAFTTFTEGIVFSDDRIRENTIGKRLLEDSDYKKELLNKLFDFDFSICDIIVEDVTKEIISGLKNNISDDILSEEGVDKLIKKIEENKEYNIKTIHKIQEKEFPLSMGLESEGTSKFIKQFINIYDSVMNGKLYISDEFEQSYHDVIQRAIIEYLFEGSDENKSQFIITTHNTNFLSSKFFAKEQINFVRKERESQSSLLYRLSDYPEVTYKKHNWEKLYLEGRFGAIPEVY